MDKRVRAMDAQLRKRRRHLDRLDVFEGGKRMSESDDFDDTVSHERWTHLATGKSYVYPLSQYLDDALSTPEHNDDDHATTAAADRALRLVLFRVNALSKVAPFLEFALARSNDGTLQWPLVDDNDDDNNQEEVDYRRTRASDMAFQLMGALPGLGHQPPRFCGAWRAEATDYAWFQVDPPAARNAATAALVWVTVHDLVVKPAAFNRPCPRSLTADFVQQPLLWCICDADRQVPIEIPITLEPLAFLPPEEEEEEEDKEQQQQLLERQFRRETQASNYLPTATKEMQSHPLFGRTMYAFHDPLWRPQLGKKQKEEEEEEIAVGTRYAVFLETALYLVGTCLRETAALLAFAESNGYSSVYLPVKEDDEDHNRQLTSSFVWLVQSSDQLVCLDNCNNNRLRP